MIEVESGFDNFAVSPVGAAGLMQILPSTYREIRERNPFMADIEEPRWNIAAGIFYDRQLYRKWKKKPDIHTAERLNFAFGSYNAGYGNILKAHKRAKKHHQTVKLTGTKGALWASWSGAMDRTRHPTFFLKAFDETETRQENERTIDKEGA